MSVDAYGAAVDEFGLIPSSANIFSTDFDDGTAGNNTLDNIGSSANQLSLEGTTAPGDSGNFIDKIPPGYRVFSIDSRGAITTYIRRVSTDSAYTDNVVTLRNRGASGDD